MATITPSPAPGPFLDPIDVTFSFTPDITGVAYSTDGSPPSISKYIAYDTLTPPNPFIAVTEDGRGRVVYDGGFPKFYIGSAPAAGTQFEGLPGGYKYAFNAIRWISNHEKVAVGNSKVLVLGDAVATENYSIKGTKGNDFSVSLDRLFAALGVQYTLKDRADYGGVLNPTLAELEEYACVVVFSTLYTSGQFISNQAINDMVTYRENGNGIFIITDHGVVLPNIQAAMGEHAGFFRTGNFICTRFGAYFSGDFNRTPVNVGFLRRTYGDHPLYNNLSDAEDISAGGSESKVVVTTANVLSPSALPPIRVDKKGINTIQILAVLANGEMVSGRYVYIIQGDEFVFSRVTNPKTGQVETNQGKLYADPTGKALAEMWVDGSVLGTVWGEVLLNGKRIGELYYTSSGGSKVYWLAGKLEYTPIGDKDAIRQAIAIPFTYGKDIVGVRDEVTITAAGMSVAKLIKDIKPLAPISGVSGCLSKIHKAVKPILPPHLSKQPISTAVTSRVVEGAFDSKLSPLAELPAQIFATTAETTTAISKTPAVPGVCIIDGATNKVYGYLNGGIRLLANLKAQDIFGAPRTLANGGTNQKFRLNLDGTITRLT